MKNLALLLILFANPTWATFFPTPQGPVSLAAGTISALITDPFSAYNHQGNLAFATKNSVSIGFQSQYFVEGLNNACLVGNYKITKTQTLGVGYSFFGNQYYNEGLLKLSIAQNFTSSLGVGISLDYLRLQLPRESYRVKNLLTFEAGMYYTFNPSFDMAIQVINPVRVKLSDYNDERLPFITNTTISYKPLQNLIIIAEWQQVMNGSGGLKVGISYKVNPHLTLSAGACNRPLNPSFGFTFMSKKISIHIAFVMHPYLNTTSAGAFTYNLPFNEKNPKK